MVKIPSFDDLKKMGSGLIDSAKSVKMSEMVDKVKSGIDSVSGRKVNLAVSDESLKELFDGLNSSLEELLQLQMSQTNAVKKIQGQLVALAATIDAKQKPQATTPPEDTTKT
jgi:hypothetical protein